MVECGVWRAGRGAGGGYRAGGQPHAALFSVEYFELEAGEVVAYIPIKGDVDTVGRTRMVEISPADPAVAVHLSSQADLDRTYGAGHLHGAAGNRRRRPDPRVVPDLGVRHD